MGLLFLRFRGGVVCGQPLVCGVLFVGESVTMFRNEPHSLLGRQASATAVSAIWFSGPSQGLGTAIRGVSLRTLLPCKLRQPLYNNYRWLHDATSALESSLPSYHDKELVV